MGNHKDKTIDSQNQQENTSAVSSGLKQKLENEQIDTAALAPQQADSSETVVKRKKRTNAKKLQAEIENLQKENSAVKDQLLRKMAEFDNFRKRTEKEYGRFITHAHEGMVQKLLPVLDDLERSLQQPANENQTDAFTKGVELIYSKFIKILEEAGLKPIESQGKEFDPEIHEAMMRLENKDIPANHIIETFEKGYYLNEKVIRHAKVSVSK